MATSLSGKAARYIVTGSISAVVDIGVFAGLLPLGLGIAVTATLSFLVASVCNYWLASRHVFGAARSLTGYGKFLIGASLGLLINVGLTAWLVAHSPLPPVAAKIVSIGVAFVFNFAVNLLVVFRTRDGSRP